MIRDVFQLPGTVPLEIDRLQRSVTSGAIAKAVLLSIKAEMPSGPVALVVSRSESSLTMVHSMSLEHSSGETVTMSPIVSGATDVLKFLPKEEVSLCVGDDAITLSVCRVGILQVFWSRHLILFQKCLLPGFNS